MLPRLADCRPGRWQDAGRRCRARPKPVRRAPGAETAGVLDRGQSWVVDNEPRAVTAGTLLCGEPAGAQAGFDLMVVVQPDLVELHQIARRQKRRLLSSLVEKQHRRAPDDVPAGGVGIGVDHGFAGGGQDRACRDVGHWVFAARQCHVFRQVAQIGLARSKAEHIDGLHGAGHGPDDVARRAFCIIGNGFEIRRKTFGLDTDGKRPARRQRRWRPPAGSSGNRLFQGGLSCGQRVIMHQSDR